MATFVAVNGGEHNQHDPSLMNGNATGVKINGIGPDGKPQYSLPTGINQIQVCPPNEKDNRKNKRKTKESSTTDSDVEITSKGDKVNVIAVRQPTLPGGATKGASDHEVSHNPESKVSHVSIKGKEGNKPPVDLNQKVGGKDDLKSNTSRDPGGYYGQCTTDPAPTAVSHIDVTSVRPGRPANKRIPIIDIQGMLPKRPQPTQVHLQPPPPPPPVVAPPVLPPPERTYTTDIPANLPPSRRPSQKEVERRAEMAVVERNMHFQEEPYVEEERWCTMAVAKHSGNGTYDKRDLSPIPSPIDSELIYEALKENKGVQTRPQTHTMETSTHTMETSTHTMETPTKKATPVVNNSVDLRESCTQTNSERGTQTLPMKEPDIGTQTLPTRGSEIETQTVLEPEVHILNNNNVKSSEDEDDDNVTEIYTEIRQVDRSRRNSNMEKLPENTANNKNKKKKKSKTDERKPPERSNSTRSNKAVPAVLKPRSELSKQIEAEGFESVEASDSDSSEISSTTVTSDRTRATKGGSDSSDTEKASERTKQKRKRREMKRLSRLDQVKKPVIFPTEIYNVKPVPALVNIRERPQLLGVFSIKTYSSNPRSKSRPTGLAISPSGNYIITDYSDKTVKIFTKSGQVKVEFGVANLTTPWGVTLLENGNVAVSDPGDTSVKIFTRKGRFVKKFEFANLVEPYGITTTNAGDILVADKGANGLYVFDGDGFLKGSLGTNNEVSTLAEWPQYVTVDKEDNIIVSDYMAHAVKIFSPSGTLIKEHGGMGTGTGQLMCPQGVCVDKYGHILVADNINSRVKVLSPEGEYIRDLLSRKSGLEAPEALAIDHDGNLVVTEGSTGEVKLFSYVM